MISSGPHRHSRRDPPLLRAKTPGRRHDQGHPAEDPRPGQRLAVPEGTEAGTEGMMPSGPRHGSKPWGGREPPRALPEDTVVPAAPDQADANRILPPPHRRNADETPDRR
jgi:hypothetical protein